MLTFWNHTITTEFVKIPCTTEHRQYVYGMIFVQVLNLRFDLEKIRFRVKQYSHVEVIYFLAAVKLHFYPKQRRSYRVKVGGSKKKVFSFLSLLSTEL